MLPYQKRKTYALPFVATSTWSPTTDWAFIIIIPLLQRRHKWILILFLALQLRWKSTVKEKWEQQPSGEGKLFTNLFLALKQWGDVGIAVSLGKRYSNICIIQDDDECRDFFVFVESRLIFFYKNLWVRTLPAGLVVRELRSNMPPSQKTKT